MHFLEAAQTIGRFMLGSPSPRRADVTIVFGMSLWHRPVETALRLHLEGLSGQFILTGGFNPRIQAAEAICMAQALRTQGVPTDQVWVDAQARHTGENVSNARRLLERHGLWHPCMTVNVVGISYHVRRILVTMNAVFGTDVHIGVASYPSKHCDPERWHESPVGRDLVLGELRKIERYFPGVLSEELLAAARVVAQQR